MSPDAPPPLPGGYQVGEKVFSTGTSQTFPNGNKLVHGQQGEVMGPGTPCLAVLFLNNKGNVNCYLNQVPPPRRLRCDRRPVPHTRDTEPHP